MPDHIQKKMKVIVERHQDSSGIIVEHMCSLHPKGPGSNSFSGVAS